MTQAKVRRMVAELVRAKEKPMSHLLANVAALATIALTFALAAAPRLRM